ncbi:MAG: DNA mismatch repair protein MutS [Alphaproteobacteria bacterium]|nr:MAG: DNA mismatch repair protein MutS [Alphaproteobacteria bacterium]
MLAQYAQIKSENPDCLLFFRLGDFYELFYEDATTAAHILNITLTKRSREKGQDVPMCGVPFHAADGYIAKLIQANQKVAICEQLETPEEAKKRGHKSIVRRGIVRVITPGTVTEQTLLEEKNHNYLACVVPDKKQWGLAYVDVSTGDFWVTAAPFEKLIHQILPLRPRELLLPEGCTETEPIQKILHETQALLSQQPKNRFYFNSAHKRLLEAYGVTTLEGFGTFETLEVQAAGALLEYIHLTQCGTLPTLKPPRSVRTNHALMIDYASLRNLEVFQTLRGERQGSLLAVIDHTQTHMGARLLGQHALSPTQDRALLARRLDAVEALVETPDLNRLQQCLKSIPDLERILMRLTMNRGGPRDLVQIRSGLQAVTHLKEVLEDQRVESTLYGCYQDLQELAQVLLEALAAEVPLLARDGGFVRHGYDKDLDELRQLEDESSAHIAMLQQQYQQQTGIPSLKIKHNQVLGYFIDVTYVHKEKVPTSFIQRQSLVNSSRYTTDALIALQEKIETATEKKLTIELGIYDQLVQKIHQHAPYLRDVCAWVAAVDVAGSHAQLAQDYGYTRPLIYEDTRLKIDGGRHPVVEQMMRVRSEPQVFTANECLLTEQTKMWLMTGPNMAGKSTFLRQNALIVLLAHMGAYVPADRAEIGCVDRLFSRVGASDDLSRGQSTFMVEMVETAAILNQATERSFVIVDEIGRGTATHDGLAIAWAIAEYLHNHVGCRSLFATHYHELTRLRNHLKRFACYTMAVKDWQGEVVFLHKVIEGIADQSYGIYVAQLAGLPKKALRRAQDLMTRFQERDNRAAQAVSAPLFEKAQNATMDAVYDQLKALNPDSLTPRQALQVLYELQSKAIEKEK